MIRQEFKAEIGQLRQELRSETSLLRKEFKGELGLFRHELKDYIDTKLADTTVDLVKRLDRREKAIKFERKVTSIFKENNIGTKKDIAYLESLA
jgi:hypothetical protein